MADDGRVGSGARELVRVGSAAAATFALVVLSSIVAPHLPMPERAAGLITFFGAAVVSAFFVAIVVRTTFSPHVVLIVDAVAVAALVVVAVTRGSSPLGAAVVDAALVSFGGATGAFVGARIQHPGHLLPACAVASCADIVSVLSPHGPTHALATNERALSILAVAFPVPGTHAAAPSIGVGDLVFLALILGGARAHALPFARTVVLGFVGLLAAGVVAAFFEAPIPALPFIAVAVIAFVPGARTLRRKDRTVATIAIGASLVIATWTIVRYALGSKT